MQLLVSSSFFNRCEACRRFLTPPLIAIFGELWLGVANALAKGITRLSPFETKMKIHRQRLHEKEPAFLRALLKFH